MRISNIWISLAFAALAAGAATAGEPASKSTADLLPRKVIVGTVMQSLWGKYPGVQERLAQLAVIIDRMAAESQKKYGRGLDLAALPEVAVTGDDGDALERSLPFDGAVKEGFARIARKHHCYIVVPMFLLENKDRKRSYNVAVLVGRGGEVVGMYRKLHLAVTTGSDSMEGGVTPGSEVPVFECDFGRLGIQICFDMEFDYGWQELARKNAELVVWPTQSPGTAHPAFRSMQYRYYIVSSTWRHNASVVEPTGKVVAQIKPPSQVLVQELDLSYAILPWSGQLKNGAALRERFGDKIGFRYYEDEDAGIFWSNDPRMTVGQMIRSLGLAEAPNELERVRGLYRKAGVPGS